MSDIFLSYAREDAAAVERLASALQSAGYSCWWDRQLVSGARYLVETESQLQAAKAVVVVWSRDSIQSHWVADEAAAGRDSGRLAALTFDGSMPPLGFRQFQVTDFSKWNGTAEDAPFHSLLTALQRMTTPSAPVRSPPQPPPAKPTRRKLITALGAAGVAAAVGTTAWLRIRTPTRSADATSPMPGFPTTPALRRPFDLIMQINAIREDVLLAEDIVQPLVDQSPADAELVTLMALVQSTFLFRNFDFSAERVAKARRYCERAYTLAPQSPMALTAQALYLAYRARDLARAEALATQATELAPDAVWPRRVLFNVTNQGTDRAKSVRVAEANVARFPRDALVSYELALAYRNAERYDDMERMLDATIALAPVAYAFIWKAAFAQERGDLRTMRAMLDQIPARLRNEERVVNAVFRYAVAANDADYGLAALDGYPDTWFHEIISYFGPKSLLQGLLLKRSGRGALARARFEAALTQIRDRRVEHPNDPPTFMAEAMALYELGQPDEARIALDRSLQSLPRPHRLARLRSGFLATIAAPMSLLLNEKASALEVLRDYASDPGSRAGAISRLRWDPFWEPLRHDNDALAILSVTPPVK